MIDDDHNFVDSRMRSVTKMYGKQFIHYLLHSDQVFLTDKTWSFSFTIIKGTYRESKEEGYCLGVAQVRVHEMFVVHHCTRVLYKLCTKRVCNDAVCSLLRVFPFTCFSVDIS